MFPHLTTTETMEELKFLGGIRLRILLPTAATNGTVAVFEDIVEPGIGPGRHIHHGEDETFFVMEGQFAFEADGKRMEAGTGDVLFVPKGTVHAFKNTGTTQGRLRYMFTPAGPVEAMFRAFHAADAKGDLTPEKMAEIAQDFDQSFVGPPLD